MQDLHLYHIDSSLANTVEQYFAEAGHLDLAAEIPRIIIPVQGIGGSLNNFSFMALSLPLLTPEQRAKAPIVGEGEFNIKFRGGVVRVDTDIFGRVSWFYFCNLSFLYDPLQGIIAQAKAQGAKSAFEYSRAF